MNNHFPIFLTAITAFAQAPDFRAAPHVQAFSKDHPGRVTTIAAADFDRKNGPDLVTVQTNGILNVIYNRGGGVLTNDYSNTSAIDSNSNVSYIEAVDLNGDEYPDAIATDTKNEAILVFLNKKDGTFADASSVAMPNLSGGAVTAADANNDGKLDIITVTRVPSPGSTVFSQQTLLGKGDGTFEPSARVDSTLAGVFFLPPGKALSIADMNRDGKRDLVLQLEQSSPKAAIVIAISTGAGNGTFSIIRAEGPTVDAGPQPASSLTMGDLNGDEIADAVFLAFSNRIYAALGQPDGSLGEPSVVLSNMSGAVLLALRDLDKNGTSDLVVFGSGDLGVFAGKGDGTFQPKSQYTGGYGLFQQPLPTDFNGDKNLDIAWLDYTNGRVGLYIGTGDGTFAAASPVRPANADSTTWAGNIQVITAADLDGDRDKDVLTYIWPHAAAGGPADLYSGLNDGTGKFLFKLALPAGRLQELGARYGAFAIESATADFNRDRRADVLLRTQSGLALLLASSDGALNSEPIDIEFPIPVGCMPFNYLTTGGMHKFSSANRRTRVRGHTAARADSVMKTFR